MRSKLLYIVLAALGLLGLSAIGLGFDAGSFQIERSAVISAPAPVVFAQLEDLHRWPAWFSWLEVEGDLGKLVHSGAAKGVGARCDWESDGKAGRNRLTILESQPPERVAARLEYTQGRARDFRLLIVLVPDGARTQVRFVLTGTDTVASKLFDRYKAYLGKDLERALSKLAAISGA